MAECCLAVCYYTTLFWPCTHCKNMFNGLNVYNWFCQLISIYARPLWLRNKQGVENRTCQMPSYNCSSGYYSLLQLRGITNSYHYFNFLFAQMKELSTYMFVCIHQNSLLQLFKCNQTIFQRQANQLLKLVAHSSMKFT